MSRSPTVPAGWRRFCVGEAFRRADGTSNLQLSSKIQAPSSREAPTSSKHADRRSEIYLIGFLKIGASLELGAWDLELHWKLKVGCWRFYARSVEASSLHLF
jgi:hypothetical protein